MNELDATDIAKTSVVRYETVTGSHKESSALLDAQDLRRFIIAELLEAAAPALRGPSHPSAPALRAAAS